MSTCLHTFLYFILLYFFEAETLSNRKLTVLERRGDQLIHLPVSALCPHDAKVKDTDNQAWIFT